MTCHHPQQSCYSHHYGCSHQQKEAGFFSASSPSGASFNEIHLQQWFSYIWIGWVVPNGVAFISPAEFILPVDWTSFYSRLIFASPAELILPIVGMGHPQRNNRYSPSRVYPIRGLVGSYSQWSRFAIPPSRVPRRVSSVRVSPQSWNVWSFWLPSQGSFAFCM